MPDYGNYGENYWNNKWPRAPIIYTGRQIQKERIAADVRSFILKDDEIMQTVIKDHSLISRTPNETAWKVQKFVCRNLSYAYDTDTYNCPEFWQFPFETIQGKVVGDCEDGGILTASLLINCGIPSWRVKVAAGYVQEAPTAPKGGHAYCIYLADRADSPRKLEWVILDWCFFPDANLPVESKPLASKNKYYKDVWFTFNNEYSWHQNSLSIKEGRISNNYTAIKENVIMEELSIDNIIDKIDRKMKKY